MEWYVVLFDIMKSAAHQKKVDEAVRILNTTMFLRP